MREPARLDLRTAAGWPNVLLVFSGLNGSGTTTTLESILLLLGRDALLVRDLPAAQGDGSQRIQLKAGTRLSGVFQDMDKGGVYPIVRTCRGTRFSRKPSVGSKAAPANVALPPEVVSSLVDDVSARRPPQLAGPVRIGTQGRGPAPTETNRL